MLIRFLEHRIGDRRIIRLIQKWLKAGVLEDGIVSASDRGTGQGSVISPLLANVYLHYVLDLWAARWRRREANGDMIIVRYADDFIVGFQYERDARSFLDELRARLQEFALSLHAEKTRLIEFGRFAAKDRKARGLGKPETFNFLGFTFICGKTRSGKFLLIRKTRRDRMRAKLRRLKLASLPQPLPCCDCSGRLMALSGGSQGGEFTSAFGGAAEVHGRTASVASEAYDPIRSSGAQNPAAQQAPDLMLANPLSCHPGQG